MGRRRKRRERAYDSQEKVTPIIVEYWGNYPVGGSGLSTSIQITLQGMALRIVDLEEEIDVSLSIIPGYHNEDNEVGYGEILASLPYTIEITKHNWNGFKDSNYKLNFSIKLKDFETLKTLMEWYDDNVPEFTGIDEINMDFSSRRVQAIDLLV